MALVRGTIVGTRYQAEALIARGGMGEVWKCTDLESKSPVALKVMKDVAADPRQMRLFRDEVHVTARLDHASIVRVYDLVEFEGALALVMELCPGEPLSSPREMTFGMLRSVLSQVLQALAYSHSRGVLHLDVKPGNVMIATRGTEARAWLVDFGIARVWRSRRERVGAELDMLSGTLGYMAPEQLLSRKHSFGPWTDLFAFGATVYRLLAGQPPFAESKPTERLTSAPPPLDTQALGLPEGLAPLLTSLLAPREADRPTHAADVLSSLREETYMWCISDTMRKSGTQIFMRLAVELIYAHVTSSLGKAHGIKTNGSTHEEERARVSAHRVLAHRKLSCVKVRRVRKHHPSYGTSRSEWQRQVYCIRCFQLPV